MLKEITSSDDNYNLNYALKCEYDVFPFDKSNAMHAYDTHVDRMLGVNTYQMCAVCTTPMTLPNFWAGLFTQGVDH